MVGIIELTGTTPKAEPIVTPPIPSAVGAGTLLANPQLFMFIVVCWKLRGCGNLLEPRKLQGHPVAGVASKSGIWKTIWCMRPALPEHVLHRKLFG